MKALLLSAGKGTRLGAITSKIPKPLIKIDGKPLLKQWIDKLIKNNIEKILINTNYMHDKINDFILLNKYSEYVTLKFEKKLLGTAGTLYKNLNFFNNDDCMFIHADNFTKDDLNDFIIKHKNRPKSCLATMMVFETNNPSSCGIVKMDRNKILTKYTEKPKHFIGKMANSAIIILSKELIQILSESKNKNEYDFCKEILPTLIGKVYCYKTNYFFSDIGTTNNLKNIKSNLI